MSFILKEVLPELASELKDLFIQAEKPHLSEQVDALQIVDRCRCGDSFCATIYTIPKPKGAWGKNHYTIPLDAEAGMIIVDVLNEKVAEIEILNRDEIRKKVLKLFP
ncbi:MAG TPA: hypothetical protein VGB00_07255 [Pyrinomonadaceae bacterium]